MVLRSTSTLLRLVNLRSTRSSAFLVVLKDLSEKKEKKEILMRKRMLPCLSFEKRKPLTSSHSFLVTMTRSVLPFLKRELINERM